MKGVGEIVLVPRAAVTADEGRDAATIPQSSGEKGHEEPWAPLGAGSAGYPLHLPGKSDQRQELLQGSSGPETWAQRSCNKTRGVAAGPRWRISKISISRCCPIPGGGCAVGRHASLRPMWGFRCLCGTAIRR